MQNIWKTSYFIPGYFKTQPLCYVKIKKKSSPSPNDRTLLYEIAVNPNMAVTYYCKKLREVTEITFFARNSEFLHKTPSQSYLFLLGKNWKHLRLGTKRDFDPEPPIHHLNLNFKLHYLKSCAFCKKKKKKKLNNFIPVARELNHFLVHPEKFSNSFFKLTNADRSVAHSKKH